MSHRYVFTVVIDEEDNGILNNDNYPQRILPMAPLPVKGRWPTLISIKKISVQNKKEEFQKRGCSENYRYNW